MWNSKASGEPSKGATMWSSKASGESRKGATSKEQRLGEVRNNHVGEQQAKSYVKE